MPYTTLNEVTIVFSHALHYSSFTNNYRTEGDVEAMTLQYRIRELLAVANKIAVILLSSSRKIPG
jgi:hypothetical protein